MAFFQEITIAGKVYSSVDDLIQLKGHLEQQLQQKRVEAGQDVDQTLRSIAGYAQREQELYTHLMNTEALLKRALDTSSYMTEQRTALNNGITLAKEEVDKAAKAVVELKTKLHSAEMALGSKQSLLQVANDQQRLNETKISQARPELLRLEKVKALAAKDLATIRSDKASYVNAMTPAKEEWRQLDANLKLVSLLVATAPPPPLVTSEAKEQPAAAAPVKVTKEQPAAAAPVKEQPVDDGSEKEHKKKKHRPTAE